MLRDFLKGLEVQSVQTVGNMTVLALVSQKTEYAGVGTVNDVYLERDSAYNNLHMACQADAPTILPSGYTLITKEKAQDRCIGSKEIIPAKGVRTVNAFCVQSSQCGYMSKENKASQQFRMLPATIRMVAHRHRNENQFAALWGSLGAYNQSSGVSGNFLKSFFDEYKDRLSQFVAEFELVPFQRGAMILINDELMGVELAPNPLAFSAQWEPLIRDCYGSEAISQQAKQKTIDESAIFGDADTLEKLEELLTKAEQSEYDFAEQQVQMVLNQNEQQSVRQTEGNLKVVDIETPDFVGQAVRSNGSIIDMTLLRRDAAERGFKFNRRR